VGVVQTSKKRALEFVIAEQLVEYGARPKLVALLTDISEGYAKKIVRDINGDGGGKRAKKDPAIWFSQAPVRLQHGDRFLMTYFKTEKSIRMAKRLMTAYTEYLYLTQRSNTKDRDPELGFNEAHDLLQLYNEGKVKISSCKSCKFQTITFDHSSTCYVCGYMDSITCSIPRCNNILPERTNGEKRGRPKLFCDRCEQKRATRKRKRKQGAVFTEQPLSYDNQSVVSSSADAYYNR